MSYFQSSILNTKYIFLLFIIISCDNKDEMDNININNNAITFYNDDQENLFPRIIVNTNGREIVDDPKINAELIVIEDKTEISYNVGIELRGSSSQMFPKKSYGFETRSTDYIDDIDVSIGGFPQEEDWILYGPYSDKSLIRNKLTFDLSNLIGYKASKTKFYNLFINGQFKGLYVLMEKIKRDVNRVDIPEIDESTVEGGYIIKIDKPTGDGESCNTCYDDSFSFASSFDSYGNLTDKSEINFIYHYPKPEEITVNQKEYIKDIIFQFESTLSEDTFDTNSDPKYNSFINVDSFIDFFIMNEITKNIDGYRLSTYMYLDKDQKLNMGPIWDFNLAFGNVDYCDGANAQGWLYKFNSICPGDVWQVPFWWTRFMESLSFRNKLKNRWQNLRSNILSDSSIDTKIDSYIEYLDLYNVIDQNFNSWPIIGQYVWPNYYIGTSYESEIDYMKYWIDMRLNWLDGQINNF